MAKKSYNVGTYKNTKATGPGKGKLYPMVVRKTPKAGSKKGSKGSGS